MAPRVRLAPASLPRTMTNGSLVSVAGHSTTPLTRRGSPGPAAAASGSPSRNNVVHAARSRDGFIGSSFAARLPQSECQTDLTRSSDPASSKADHRCRESRHRTVVVRSDTRGHSETIGPTLYTQTGALASGQRMSGSCGRRYAASRAVGVLRAALRADGPAQIDGARREAGAE